jgi:hypothetical protein
MILDWSVIGCEMGVRRAHLFRLPSYLRALPGGVHEKFVDLVFGLCG